MSFNSGRICHYCMATNTNMKEMFSETNFALRTAEVHQCHLNRIQQFPDDRVTYGVNSPSPFEELPYFDVTTSLPPNIMHDLLEEVIPLVVELVISKAHTERHITIREVKEEMQTLCIGQNEKKNKPVQLSGRLQNVGVAGSASQNLCIFRLLPFVIAHCVSVNCKY